MMSHATIYGDHKTADGKSPADFTSYFGNVSPTSPLLTHKSGLLIFDMTYPDLT